MQGKLNVGSSERKGPHKSMHCKFCKPPGVVTPEKLTRPQLETKTKLHLAHEGADLRLIDVVNEPGVLEVETDACVCILEGEDSCPKCLPDKNRTVRKKKVCRCPKGAKPHPNMNDGEAPKKKKQKDEDDEFWWEKYSREHDAIARETWAAYTAQRRKDKKLEKCQKREQKELMSQKIKGVPDWYQKLSCQQMIYVEFLSTAIRLDSDENITDRTFFVLGGIGLYPRPRRKILRKCLRFCHYNSIQFLNQLHLLTKNDDVFKEKTTNSGKILEDYRTWNERLIMNSICHLEFPMILREIMDRLPTLPRASILPQIPYPAIPKPSKKKYDNPYDEPIWQDRLNWVEKMKIDRINRCRAHMDTKRVKIPALALVRRPSLIDARPHFLAQIEANERASRRPKDANENKKARKHPVSTFNSAVDVTAIAGIDASEISTTDRADTDELCVFLREPLREPPEEEDELGEAEKEVTFLQVDPYVVTTQIDQIKPYSDLEENSDWDEIDISFKTPPKTESGKTIEQPCLPPKSSPAPPAIHYDVAKRELDIVNQELCGFFPFISTSTQTVDEQRHNYSDDVTSQLMSAAEKLKLFAEPTDPKGEKDPKDKRKKCKKKTKYGRGKPSRKEDLCKKGKDKSEGKRNERKKKINNVKTLSDSEFEANADANENESKNGRISNEIMDFERELMDEYSTEEGDDTLLNAQSNSLKNKKKLNKRESIISDPDPDSDAKEWSVRAPCIDYLDKIKANKQSIMKRPKKTKKRKTKIRVGGNTVNNKMNTKRSMAKEKVKSNRAEDDMNKLQERDNPHSEETKEMASKANKETMTECYSGQFDQIYRENAKKEVGKRERGQGAVFEDDVNPLVINIIQDLADEGYVSASYRQLNIHPDIEQLIQYLRGEIITKQLREELHVFTKAKWATMAGLDKFAIPDLNISPEIMQSATWKDKGWISRRAKARTDEFYFKAAAARANYSRSIYQTLQQNYFGTGRYLKIYYAYMLPRYEEAILRGIL